MPLTQTQPLLAPEQVFQLLVAGWCAIVTLMLAVLQAALSLHQRWRDLRWKQSEMALRLVDEAVTYPPSAAALELIDEHTAVYKVDDKQEVIFTYEDVVHALAVPPQQFDRKTAHVRHCFDSLFYYFDRFEQLIRTGALRFEDIDTPWNWYATQLARKAQLYRNYIQYIDYPRAIKFLERYGAWKATPQAHERGGLTSR